MKSMHYSMATVVVAALLGACAPMAEQTASDTPINSKTQLVVDNQNWLDMNVYVVREGIGQRLGTVTSMTKATFRVPDAYVIGVSDLQVAARPIGSNEQFVSTNINVFPGSQINLQLQHVLSMSYYSVRPLGMR